MLLLSSVCLADFAATGQDSSIYILTNDTLAKDLFENISGDLQPIKIAPLNELFKDTAKEIKAVRQTLIIGYNNTIEGLRGSHAPDIKTLPEDFHYLNLGKKTLDSAGVISSVKKIHQILSKLDPSNDDIYQFNLDLFTTDLEIVFSKFNKKIIERSDNESIFITTDQIIHSLLSSLDLNVFLIQHKSQLTKLLDRFERPMLLYTHGDQIKEWINTSELTGPFYIDPDIRGSGPKTYLDIMDHNFRLLDNYPTRKRQDSGKKLKKITFEKVIWGLAILALLIFTGILWSRKK